MTDLKVNEELCAGKNLTDASHHWHLSRPNSQVESRDRTLYCHTCCWCGQTRYFDYVLITNGVLCAKAKSPESTL